MNVWKNVGTTISGQRYLLLLCTLIFCMVTMLELRVPYFFLQDDNRVQHLPFYVHNIRALLNGEFPFYNFHQYLGIPVGIQNAALYPFNYFGLLLSKLFLGHYFGAMEFIALIHLLIAGTGFFYLMRSFRVNEPASLFGAIAYTFCGYLITFGNSWIQTLDCASYLPWILLYGLQLAGKGGYANFLILVGIRVLALLVGYPQLYVYIATFEVITVAAILVASHILRDDKYDTGYSTPHLVRGNWVLYIFSHLAALGIAMPLLLSAYHQAAVSLKRKSVLGWDEYIANSYDVKLWLNGLIAPLHDYGIATWSEQQFLSHIGYLPLLCVIVALLTLYKNSPYRIQILVCAGCAVISLLWSADTAVTRLVYYLPVFNKFKYPFKLSLFSSFYLIVIATFGFDLICRKVEVVSERYRFALRMLIPLLLTLHIINFFALYAFSRQHSFAQMLDSVPFDEPFKEQLSSGRIVSVIQKDINDNPLEKAVGYTVPLLGYDYATLWGVYHLGGHDSLVPEDNFNAAFGLDYTSMFKVRPGSTLSDEFKVSLEDLSRWGVKWYIVDGAFPISEVAGLKLFSEDSSRKIYFNPSALPFAFWNDSPAHSEVQCKFRTNSIVLQTQRSTAGMLLVNVLWNPFFSAEIDGKDAAIIETEEKQLLLKLPAGNHVVIVKYSNPYFIAGLYVSLFTIAVIIGFGLILRRQKLKRDSRISDMFVGGCC